MRRMFSEKQIGTQIEKNIAQDNSGLKDGSSLYNIVPENYMYLAAPVAQTSFNETTSTAEVKFRITDSIILSQSLDDYLPVKQFHSFNILTEVEQHENYIYVTLADQLIASIGEWNSGDTYSMYYDILKKGWGYWKNTDSVHKNLIRTGSNTYEEIDLNGFTGPIAGGWIYIGFTEEEVSHQTIPSGQGFIINKNVKFKVSASE